jgi:hypothetical protein
MAMKELGWRIADAAATLAEALGACLGNRRILLAKEARVRFCPWG